MLATVRQSQGNGKKKFRFLKLINTGWNDHKTLILIVEKFPIRPPWYASDTYTMSRKGDRKRNWLLKRNCLKRSVLCWFRSSYFSTINFLCLLRSIRILVYVQSVTLDPFDYGYWPRKFSVAHCCWSVIEISHGFAILRSTSFANHGILALKNLPQKWILFHIHSNLFN